MPTALITGANSGIGLAAASELASRGWNIAITARSPERGTAALERIRAGGDSGAELILLDLASLASVRRAAGDALERIGQIDVLINNAGVNLSRRSLTEDGLDAMMQVNHFGHFLFTSLLLPRLLESPAPRIVNVSSRVHYRATLDFDDLALERARGPMVRYGASKLANVLFTKELHRRRADSSLSAFAVHPGGVRTRFGADGDLTGPVRLIWRAVQPFLLSAEQGAEPVVHLAASEAVREHSGAYFNRMRPAQPSKHATPEAAAKLWAASCELTGAEWPENGAGSEPR